MYSVQALHDLTLGTFTNKYKAFMELSKNLLDTGIISTIQDKDKTKILDYINRVIAKAFLDNLDITDWDATSKEWYSDNDSLIPEEH
jgi:hypothetical protein